VRIRAAVIGDAPFLRAMIWEAIRASPTFVAIVGEATIRGHEDEYWRGWTTENEAAWVAVDGSDRPIGAVMLRPDEDGRRLAVAVADGERGRGVGAALMFAALVEARALGAVYVKLFVDPANEVALAWYERLGFTRVGEKPGAIEMRLSLGS
jgi:ribosomal protein S18 acetylase RimI-like enzyme